MALATEPLDPPAADGEAGEDAGPRLYGVIDVLRPDRIAGWAIDRTDSNAAVEIDVLREGVLVETVRADRLRRDLERGNVGTGRYGFVCRLNPPLDAGFEFTVAAVARSADGVTAELRRTGAAGRADGTKAERRLVERIFELVSRPAEPPAAPVEIERLDEILHRLEVAQARIEAALAAVAAPPPAIGAGMKVMLGLALGTAALSLGIGIASMLVP